MQNLRVVLVLIVLVYLSKDSDLNLIPEARI